MSASVRSRAILGSEASRSREPAASSSAAKHTRSAQQLQNSQRLPSSLSSASQAPTAKSISHERSRASSAVSDQRGNISTATSSSSSSLARTLSSSGESSSRPSASSGEETPTTPSTSNLHPSAGGALPSNTTDPYAQSTAVASRGRPKVAAAASPAAKSRGRSTMLDNDFALPPVSVSANLNGGGGKSTRILGPDGQLYTQGEAARLGLIIRTACEACRNRKLKCSGTLPENGGCERCKSDNITCVYSARAPIGRPKKRKAEDGGHLAGTPAPSLNSPATKSSIKPKAKGKAVASDAPNHVPAKVKAEEGAWSDSPFVDQDPLRFTSNPVLRHTRDSTFHSDIDHLPVSPAHSDKAQRDAPQDGQQAAWITPQPFGLYGNPLQTPGLPISNNSSSRLTSTPTVWSQNVPFAMTPSDTLTPHSVISPAVASHSLVNGQNSQASESRPSTSSVKLPSLDDLSVAAFLQSLDTLEISPAELLQQQQQQQQQQLMFHASDSNASTPGTSANLGLGAPFAAARNGNSIPTSINQLTASSVEEWAINSAILQPGLSFAVPADFSWWDLGLNGADFGGSAVDSVSATPSSEVASTNLPAARTVPSQSATSLSQSIHGSVVDGSGIALHSSSPAMTVTGRSGRSRRPTFSADRLWPRGAEAGMGQGQIQHTVAATETGLGWSTLPGPSRVSEALSSPVESQIKKGGESSCCSYKTSKSCPSSPVEASISRDVNSPTAVKASCCSSKSSGKKPAEEVARPACCCEGKGKAAAPQAETKSCCSSLSAEASNGARATAVSPALAEADHGLEMGPLSTSAAVTGNSKDALDSERKRHAPQHSQHSHQPSKVHCVPNPSGKGCTCLCDMSVALLSVKQVLRETDPHKQSSSATASPSRKENSLATDTIQLTLTASQAITAQCACSADCPTCQSDPSTEISASLLVSTALQIYARAVRILREGFAASGKTEADPPAAAVGAVQGFFGGLDVTIGTYKPSTSNAKKIALYAIKLELKDLRRALGLISRMAQNFNRASTSGTGAGTGTGAAPATAAGVGEDESEAAKSEGLKGKLQGQGMNPIDQLVILKLYRQLTELLKTVEGLEEAA